MPYYITDKSSECSSWAVVKEDGEVMACHNTKAEAQAQMVAISLSEGIEPGGERDIRALPGDLKVGDYVSWNSSGGRARGEIQEIVDDGSISPPNSSVTVNGTEKDPAALIQVYQRVRDGWEDTDVYVAHKFSTLTKIAPLPEPSDEPEDEEDEDMEENSMSEAEYREVNLEPPAYMRAAARRGLKYYEEGYGGDGLVERTIREARAMAAGNVTADKWVRIRAWIARHLPDLDSPAARPDSPDYPSPGVVAHLLWGSGPSKRAAQRALTYAEGVVARIEEENEGRAKGEALSKIETRRTPTSIEVREEGDGMRFSGYAAVFNSASEPLPFIERIAPGAFRKSLRARNDIKFLWNHDAGEVLGSTRAGTLMLTEDEKGLRVDGLLPNTSRGRDVAELLRRGDVDAMSFGFSVPAGGDSWSEDGSERTLNSVRLFEVSLVSWPAYTATAGTVAVRGLDKIAKRADIDADALADAVYKLEEGETLTEDEGRLIQQAVETLMPKSEGSEPSDNSVGQAMLALKKKKLELLLNGI
jgi:HK97 family phage prohead protease